MELILLIQIVKKSYHNLGKTHTVIKTKAKFSVFSLEIRSIKLCFKFTTHLWVFQEHHRQGQATCSMTAL